MTTEKTLERAAEILRSFSEDDQKTAERVLNDPVRWTYSAPPVLLAELIKDLRAELAKETATKSGKRNTYAAALRILKRGSKTVRAALGYAYTTPDGMQIICDSYSLVKLSEPLPLPVLPENLEPINYSRIIPETIPAENIDLPDLAKLRAYIKQCKAEKKLDNSKRVIFDFGDGLPTVDAELLADIMAFTPDAKRAANAGIMQSIYIKSENAFGMLCPIKPQDGHRTRTEI